MRDGLVSVHVKEEVAADLDALMQDVIDLWGPLEGRGHVRS